MSSGSNGTRKCSICGSKMPHFPVGSDSCEWDPKRVQLSEDKNISVNELKEALAQSESRRKELYRALSDLLEQIECLDGIEYTKDIEPYKAEAIWNDVIRQAQDALKEPK